MRAFFASLSLAVFCVACGGKTETVSPPAGGGLAGGVGGAAARPSSGEPGSPEETAAEIQTGPVNVVFPAGFDSVTLRGKVTKEQKAVYFVSLTAGDILSVKIVESNANNDVVFSIMSPFDHSLVGEAGADYDTEWKAKVAETGKFTVTVSTVESDASAFAMEIELTEPTA